MAVDDFLLARVDEDEAMATQWWPERFGSPMVLECETKRRIVAAWRAADGCAAEGLRLAVLHLAARYADHPDWRAEWRP